MTQTAISPAQAGVRLGDFFVRSWGYDQTNIDFYKVVGLTPKGVKLQQWSPLPFDDNHIPTERIVPGDNPHMVTVWPEREPGETCETCDHPDPWALDGMYGNPRRLCQTHGPRQVPAPIQTKRLKDGGFSRPTVNVGGWDIAQLWDCAPQSQTAAGWGH